MSIQDPPYSLHAPRHARLRHGHTRHLAADNGAGAIAVVVHGESDAPLGLLAEVLATGPVAPQIIRATRGQPLPDVRTVSVAVWLGALEHGARADRGRAVVRVEQSHDPAPARGRIAGAR